MSFVDFASDVQCPNELTLKSPETSIFHGFFPWIFPWISRSFPWISHIFHGFPMAFPMGIFDFPRKAITVAAESPCPRWALGSPLDLPPSASAPGDRFRFFRVERRVFRQTQGFKKRVDTLW